MTAAQGALRQLPDARGREPRSNGAWSRRRHGTVAVSLALAGLVLGLCSPALADATAPDLTTTGQTRTAETWTAYITRDGDLQVSGSPWLETARPWVPGDLSRSTLTLRNDLDGPVVLTLEARVDGDREIREALRITAGTENGSALAPGGVVIAVLAGGETADVPVAVEFPESSGNASQGRSASVDFVVRAVESTPAPEASTAGPTPASPNQPDASSPAGPDRAVPPLGIGQQQPSHLARTGTESIVWLAAGLTLLGAGMMLRQATRRSAGVSSRR